MTCYVKSIQKRTTMVTLISGKTEWQKFLLETKKDVL